MRSFTRIGLLASTACAGLLAVATNPADACITKNLAGSEGVANSGQPLDFSSKTPDFKAMGIALAGLGTVVSGLAALGFWARQRQLEKQAAEAEIALFQEGFVGENVVEKPTDHGEALSFCNEVEDEELVLTR